MNTTQIKKVSLTPIDQNKLLSGLRSATKEADTKTQLMSRRNKQTSDDKRDVEIRVKELSDKLVELSDKMRSSMNEMDFHSKQDLAIKVENFIHIMTYNESNMMDFLSTAEGINQLQDLIDQLELTLYLKTSGDSIGDMALAI